MSGWTSEAYRAVHLKNAETLAQRRLLALNAFACCVHLVSGILGSLLSAHDHTTVQVYEPLFEYNGKGSNASTFFTHIPHNLFEVRVLWPYVAVEYITAFFHLWYFAVVYVRLTPAGPAAAVFRPLAALNDWLTRHPTMASANPLRWWEYAVTASLLAAFGGVVIGLNQFPYFLHILSSGVALQMCGYLLEMLDYRVALHQRIAVLAWNLGTVLNLTSVGVLLYQIFASKTHTTVFYYNVVPFSIWYNTFGVVAWLSFIRYRQFADRFFTENWYIILSLSSKVSIFWLSFATFRQLAENNGFLPRTHGVDWTAVRNVASYLPLGLVAGVAALDARRWAALKALPQYDGANAFVSSSRWKE